MLIAFFSLMTSATCTDEYADLMRSDVTARVLPLNISVNSSEPVSDATCSFTLHRTSCKNPALKLRDKISWHTRICFEWKCNVAYHAMRVENCWVGTRKSPVYLVRPDGCTAESALLHTPSYASFTRAVSVGWLSIRQAGVTELLVSCDISLCHFCDEWCREHTPPRLCRDTVRRNYDRMWNESAVVERLCNPPIETTTSKATAVLLTSDTLPTAMWSPAFMFAFVHFTL